MNRKIKVIISGGGTGGHIFPAIAIARALQKTLNGNVEILFVGANGKMEMEKVPEAGFPIKGVDIAGLQRSFSLKNIIKNIMLPFKMWKSMKQTRRIFDAFKPDVVAGVGGFASWSTLQCAAKRHLPYLIQEQNSYAGITNKKLASKASKICVAYDNMEHFFPKEKIIFTGNPIRPDVIDIEGKREEALQFFNLTSGKKTLLVIGGSLGASSINQAIEKGLSQFEQSGLQIIWQTGKYDIEHATEISRNFPNVHAVSFIKRMDLAYAAADVIVSRAGAIAISELCHIGKPVIFVPYPYAAENHQYKNAQALVEKQAAELIPDNECSNKLTQVVINVLDNETKMQTLSKNIKSLATNDADMKIAAAIVDLSLTTHKTNTIFFVGIGGIGMSALARYFKLQGKDVSGYDLTPSPLTERLIAEGISVFYEDNPTKLPQNIDLAIFTPAVPDNLKLFATLAQRNVPIKKRADILGQITRQHETIAVAGTHGKTTTTAILAHIFYQSPVGCTAFVGGIANNYQSNFFSNSNTPFIVEADEYDRSLLHLNPAAAAINAMDSDHLDIYGTQDALIETYNLFANQIDSNGFIVVKKGLENHITATVKVFTASIEDSSADYYPANIRIVDGYYHFDLHTPRGVIDDVVFGGGGFVNIANAVTAAALALQYGIDTETVKVALASFAGVQRRFQFRIRDEKVVLIDDYAHHPEEIRMLLQSVRHLYPDKKITAVFQPHLYSRTRDFAADFAQTLAMADELLLLDIYPARELPIEGVSSDMILSQMPNKNGKLVSKQNLINELLNIKPQVVVMLGAGDIDRLVAPVEETLLATIKFEKHES